MTPDLIAFAVAGTAVVVIGARALVRWRRRRSLIAKYGAEAVGARRKPFRVRERLPAILMLAGFACAVIAFAQTRIEREASQATVMLTMDVSQSMERTDVRPSRLAAAREAAEAFLARLPEDFHVGVVTFADEATTSVLPGSERSEAGDAFGSTSSSRGTVIGDGLSAAIDAIEEAWHQEGRGPAAVVLLSDGRDTGSAVTPDDAAGRAADAGVPVFTVTLGQVDAGAGGDGTADDDLMKRVAATTGGRAFTALNADSLTGVYEQLGSSLGADLEVGSTAWIFVLAGGAFALAACAVLFLPATPAEYRSLGRRPARSRP